MVTKIWRGDAPAVAQVVRITPANVVTGDSFSLTMNGKTITVTATASGSANVVDQLVAAIGATEIAEFSELIATNDQNTLLLTAAEPGIPFTVTATAANGSTMGVTVASVQDGRAAVNMVQQFAVPKSASGTFTINVGNAVTANINCGETAANVQTAIQGLSTVGSANATVTRADSADGNDDVYSVTFVGSLAGVTVATMIVRLTSTRPIIRTIQQGATTGTPRNEIQTIDLTNANAGVSFTLTLDGQTTTSISINADNTITASNIRSAINDLSNVDNLTTVVTNSGAVYTVEFTYTEGSHAQSQLTASVYSASATARTDLTVTTAAAAVTALNDQQRITLTGVPTGGTFTLTFGGQTTSALAWNASVSAVQTALRALSSIGGGNVNVTSDNGYLVEFVGTMAAANQPLITGNGSSLTGGSAQSITVSTVTSSSGPNHWDTAANWLPAGVPVNGDDVRFEVGDSDCLYGLDQSAITLGSLEISSMFTGVIGLPRVNDLDYLEYRTRDLTLKCPTILIGHGNGSGSGKIQLNTLDAACTLELRNSGGSSESGVPAVTWYGSHASNAIVVINGDLGVAIWSDQTATINTVRQYGGQLRLDHSTVEDLYAAGQQISAHDTTLGGQPLEL